MKNKQGKGKNLLSSMLSSMLTCFKLLFSSSPLANGDWRVLVILRCLVRLSGSVMFRLSDFLTLTYFLYTTSIRINSNEAIARCKENADGDTYHIAAGIGSTEMVRIFVTGATEVGPGDIKNWQRIDVKRMLGMENFVKEDSCSACWREKWPPLDSIVKAAVKVSRNRVATIR
ncbi:hypothetical protein L484_024553 [Morus notabilis]|uniref:Uncharacterized protein n=1 Tax=Morus notabilis TaxID=981085 RepID=W9RQT5_9ROSA|nr:hypothetical protein L484_024553 [Morus notabilis]